MIKLSALTTFLLNLDLFAAEQLEAVVDDLVIVPGGHPSPGVTNIKVCGMDYTAVIFIERYPHKQVSANVLFAQVAAWLLDNDNERTDYTFPVNVDVIDAETADIEIRLTFREYITATQQSGGNLLFNGIGFQIDV